MRRLLLQGGRGRRLGWWGNAFLILFGEGLFGFGSEKEGVRLLWEVFEVDP
jgi:hypothetical protein